MFVIQIAAQFVKIKSTVKSSITEFWTIPSASCYTKNPVTSKKLRSVTVLANNGINGVVFYVKIRVPIIHDSASKFFLLDIFTLLSDFVEMSTKMMNSLQRAVLNCPLKVNYFNLRMLSNLSRLSLSHPTWLYFTCHLLSLSPSKSNRVAFHETDEGGRSKNHLTFRLKNGKSNTEGLSVAFFWPAFDFDQFRTCKGELVCDINKHTHNSAINVMDEAENWEWAKTLISTSFVIHKHGRKW